MRGEERVQPSRAVEVFFNPRSIAVVGASARPGSIGRAILENLLDSYKGKIFPVNPRYTEILGLPSYPTLLDVPETPELAVITVRAELVPEIAEQAGERGVRGLIVVSGGFAEAGEEGRRLEEELVRIVRRHGMRLVGPNCIGVYDATTGVDTFFIPHTRMRRPPHGPIAVVSQSGAFLTTFMDFIASEGVGIVRAINIGNKADVDEVDLIRYLAGKRDTRVIMLYLEDVKPGRGRELMNAALEARAARKSIVVLKGGKTESGERAASSHTAALAGDYRVLRAALRQAGMVEVEGPVEFLDAAKALTSDRRPEGRRVTVVTHAGGPGVISTDLLSGAGLEVPPLPEDLRERLRKVFPARVALVNPIDLTGDASEEDYEKALSAVIESGFGDMIYIIAYIQPPTISKRVGQVIVDAYRRAGKPFIVLTGGSPEGEELARELYREHGIPTYTIIERAVNAASALYRDSIKPCATRIPIVKAGEAECRPGEKMLDHEALDLLRSYGVRTPRYCVARSPSEARSCYEEIGGRVVAKVLSTLPVHKSDIGGVVLGITSREEAERAFHSIKENYARAGLPGESFVGVLYMEMVEGGVELFIGAKRDPAFGPVVLYGAGGILVELLGDVSVRVAPIEKCEAERMLGETRVTRLLQGYRGIHADTSEVVRAITAVSRLISEQNVAEVDVNPLIATGRGAYAVDARIIKCGGRG